MTNNRLCVLCGKAPLREDCIYEACRPCRLASGARVNRTAAGDQPRQAKRAKIVIARPDGGKFGA